MRTSCALSRSGHTRRHRTPAGRLREARKIFLKRVCELREAKLCGEALHQEQFDEELLSMLSTAELAQKRYLPPQTAHANLREQDPRKFNALAKAVLRGLDGGLGPKKVMAALRARARKLDVAI